MKKIYLALLFLLPTMIASAAGPIKTWNDQLDDFIVVFNEIDPALEQIYLGNGIDDFTFTYFDPDTGNVIKEMMINDEDAYNKVTDDVMQQARAKAQSHLASSVSKNARMKTIANEFAKKNTNVVLMYSYLKDDQKLTKKATITPSEIK